MNEISLIAFYNDKRLNNNRNYVTASNAKLEYILDVLNRQGIHANIFSPCQSRKGRERKEARDYKGNTLYFVSDTFFPNKVLSMLDHALFKLKFTFLLLKKIPKNSVVYVYHSLYYKGLVTWLKKIKRVKLVLEVEEVYSDVNGNASGRKKELAYFDRADAFLFPSYLLNELVNTEKKPYVISHGTYGVPPLYKEKFGDGLIHCVYAGTFEKAKGGVYNAIKAAEYLDGKYHLHILGTGTAQELSEVEDLISETQKKSNCQITYDGIKLNESFDSFLQMCDVGLSTQNPSGAYNDTSFPSKILTYLCNGLRVVTIGIPAVRTSDVHELLYYYDADTPESIASAIKQIDFNQEYDSRAFILQISDRFKNELASLFTKTEDL